MYSVYVDGICIYDDTSTDKKLRLVNPVLDLSDSAAGSFKMTVPITNVGYDFITRMVSDVVIKKDDEEIWFGRVLDESIDFWKNRALVCEGALAFLNDSTQPPADYANATVKTFLQGIISVHNVNVPRNRQFYIGKVTVNDPVPVEHRYTNYETTIECINKGLLEPLGGHLLVRRENGRLYIDYLADISVTNTQTIEFGVNLLDYAASYDMSAFATVVVPLGKNLGPGTIGDLDMYKTVATVSPDGSIYVKNEEAIATYGWIERVIHFEEVEDAQELYDKGELYLSSLQFDSLSLEVKALDLHYLRPEIESMKIGEMVHVISLPHGLDRNFPVTKLSIPLDKPENSQFTLGTKNDSTLTSSNNKTNSDLVKQISSLPTKDTVAGVTQKSVDEAFSSVHLSHEPTDEQWAELPYIIAPNSDTGGFTPWTQFDNQDTGNPPATPYNFKEENGWIISTNEGITNTYSYGTMTFSFPQGGTVVVRCECYGRPSSDSFGKMDLSYGIISNLFHSNDGTLDHGGLGHCIYPMDGGGTVKYDFHGKNPGTSVDLVYTIPSGTGLHYITFKFINKSNASGGGFFGSSTPEYLRLRAFTSRKVISGGTSKIILSGSGFSGSSTEVQFPGIVKFGDLLNSGNPVLNGANIQNGSIDPVKIDWIALRESPIAKMYLSDGVYLWYDATANKLKINVNGTDRVIS